MQKLSVLLVFLSFLFSCKSNIQKPTVPLNESLPETHPNLSASSQYVTMQDGTKIAVDIIRPKKKGKFPAVFILTRYWRSFDLVLSPPPGAVPESIYSELVKFLAKRGIAVVVVDVRGTGASTGTWPHPWSAKEIQDYGELADWVARQDWCNGNVGATGDSYFGSSALLLAASGSKAVKAVAPRFIEYDVYRDILMPGGMLAKGFMAEWQKQISRQDANVVPGSFPWIARVMVKGVLPVYGQEKTMDLALQAHKQNTDVFAAAEKITFRDDIFGGVPVDNFSVHSFQKKIEESGVQIFVWGSWMDSGTGRSVLRVFRNWKNPVMGLVGPWSHTGSEYSGPFPDRDRPDVAYLYQLNAITKFFLDTLRDGKTIQRTLHYYTYGKETWEKSATWPLKTKKQTFYLNKNKLTDSPTKSSSNETLPITLQATTGTHNRWLTQMTREEVVYPDLSKKGLVYQSEPFSEQTEITGTPVLHTYIKANQKDAAIFAYLELIEDGKPRYLSEGGFRAIHAKLAEQPIYPEAEPSHTYKRADAQELQPGKITKLSFGLLPISVVAKKGSAIRLVLRSHDSIFVPVNTKGSQISIHSSKEQPSALELPVVVRKE
ncbi:MAG: CocE/NonD family hydrolase [Spirochaetota bacterium]